MDQVVINTKKGKFALLDVRKVQTTDEYLIFFFGDEKVRIPLDDIISFLVS